MVGPQSLCHAPACMPIGRLHGEPFEERTWASLREGFFCCASLLTHADLSTSSPIRHERCQDCAIEVPGTPTAAQHSANAHTAPPERSSAPAHGAGVTGEPTTLCWAWLGALGRCLFHTRTVCSDSAAHLGLPDIVLPAAHAEPSASAGGSRPSGLVDDGPEDLTADDGPEPPAEQIIPSNLAEGAIQKVMARFGALLGV